MVIEVVWLPTHASWLNQIEIWFSVLQRKVLQPNHFNTRDELATTIADFIQRENQSPKPIQWTYTAEKLALKLGIN